MCVSGITINMLRSTRSLSRSLSKIARTSQGAFAVGKSSTLTPFKTAPSHRFYSSYLSAGQPIHETHPHYIRPGELTPGISAQEYYDRRKRILEELPDKSLVIIAGNDVQFATNSVFNTFRQDPNFFYLTGFLEPGSALVLWKDSENKMESIFFVPGKDYQAELWDGVRAGPNGAIEMFNADRAYPFGEIHGQLKLLLKDAKTVYMDTFDSKNSNRLHQFFKSHGQNVFKNSLGELFRNSERKEYKSAIALIEKYRLVKSEAEIDNLRYAAELSSIAYNKAYGTEFKTEGQLHAFLDYEFKISGCDEPAYIPVVAGGNHALTIHYTRNDNVLKDGDMVLVDAGGRFGGYCADISRTWPVNGKFTEPQKDLYQACLNVNKECIKLCTVSSGLSLHDIHSHSESVMLTELKNAGFANLTRRHLHQLYPHYIGHNLGIDVHDITQPPRHSKLLPGQVITIEPGVYVPEGESDVFPKHFRGIGIRIEDDVVVGKTAYEVLTVDTLKEISDIEEAAEARH